MKHKYRYQLKKRTFKTAMRAMGCKTFTQVAEKLDGVSRQAVSQWWHGDRPIPPERRQEISLLGESKVKPEELISKRIKIRTA